MKIVSSDKTKIIDTEYIRGGYNGNTRNYTIVVGKINEELTFAEYCPFSYTYNKGTRPTIENPFGTKYVEIKHTSKDVCYKAISLLINYFIGHEDGVFELPTQEEMEEYFKEREL